MRPQRVSKNLLLKLLNQNKFTHRQIAARLGCSSERVRQLELELLGRNGHQAKHERCDLRFRKKFEKMNFVKAARQRNLSVSPVKSETGRWYDRKLYVNGKTCLLRRARLNVGYKGKYVSIRRPTQQADVCVLDLASSGFLIIPMKEMPSSVTMFRSSSDGVHSSKSTSWRKYLNNWGILLQSSDRLPHYDSLHRF
jgi:hypothetical protein